MNEDHKITLFLVLLELPLWLGIYGILLLITVYMLILSFPLTPTNSNNSYLLFGFLIFVLIFIILIYIPFDTFVRTKKARVRFISIIQWHKDASKTEEKIKALTYLVKLYAIFLGMLIITIIALLLNIAGILNEFLYH